MILIAGLAGGCAGGRRPKTPDHKPEKPIVERLVVNTGPGGATARAADAAHTPTYHIAWKSAKIDLSDRGLLGGSMEQVTGEMYAKGKPVNSFRADRAKADRKTQILSAEGEVLVFSKEFAAKLACQRLEWDAKKNVVKAMGGVVLTGTNGQGAVGPVPELWATPDLHLVATPDMFKQP